MRALKAFFGELQLEQAPHFGFVFDDEDRWLFGFHVGELVYMMRGSRLQGRMSGRREVARAGWRESGPVRAHIPRFMGMIQASICEGAASSAPTKSFDRTDAKGAARSAPTKSIVMRRSLLASVW